MIPAPPTKTDRIRRGFSVYATVASYGLDGWSGQPSTGMAAELGLCPDVFFDELYEPRPADETFLSMFLRSEAMSLWVTGSVGVGKTTLVHKVLRDHSRTFNVPILVVDFMTARIELGDTHEPEGTYYAVDRFLCETLETSILEYLRRREISRSKLAIVFLHPNRTGALVSVTGQRILQEIIESDGKHDSNQRSDWVRQESERNPDGTVALRLRELGAALTLRDILFAISEINTESPKRRAVVFFDNLDSVRSISARRAVSNWLKNEAVTFARAATFVMCVRPENREKYSTPQETVDSDLSEMVREQLFSNGASVAMRIGLDPPAIGDYEPRQDPFANSEDENAPESSWVPMPAHDSAVARRQVFDDRIHERRLQFLAKCADSKRVDGVSPADIAAIAGACREIRRVHAIAIAADALANGNRRDMLASIAGFLEYIIVDLGLSWEKLGFAGDAIVPRRWLILKSLYYRWLATGGRATTNPPVFRAECFDLIEWFDSAGWKSELGGPVLHCDYVRGTFGPVHALRYYYILTCVYNLMHNTVDFHSRLPIRVSEVIRVCSLLGMPTEVVEETLCEIVGDRKWEHGFLECTRYRAIISGSTITSNDEIAVTDRTCQLLETTGVMVNYLAELLARRNATTTGSEHDSSWPLNGLIEPDRLLELAKWLRKTATTEMRVLQNMRDRNPQSAWLEDYKRYFCIATTVPTRATEVAQRSLLVERMIRSALSYLRWRVDRKLEQKIKNTMLLVNSEINSLHEKFVQNVVPQVVRGENVVPQNRPMGEKW